MKRAAYLTAMAVGLLVASELVLQYRAQAAQFDEGDKIQIHGQALNMNNTATGANTTIRIDVNSWSTTAQRTQLIFDKKDNKIEIENYGTEPVRLRQLKVEVRK